MSAPNLDDFPQPQDIQALVHSAKMGEVRSALGERGIFVLAKKPKVAGYVQRFDFSRDWYTRTFGTGDFDSTSLSIVGARVEDVRLDRVESASAELADVALRVDHEPSIVNISHRGNHRALLVQYERLRPGHASIFSREKREVELLLRPVAPTGVELVCFPGPAPDALVARLCIEVVLNRARVPSSSISLDELPLQARVDLFDAVFGHRRSADWRVVNICRLKVRSSDRCEAAEDGGDTGHAPPELSDSQVTALQSAVLSGSHLRDAGLVSSLLDEDYYFSACTFWARRFKGTTTHQIRVTIDFKARPKVLVVDANDIRSLDGEPFEGSRQHRNELSLEVVEFYWNLVHAAHAEQKRTALTSSLPVR